MGVANRLGILIALVCSFLTLPASSQEATKTRPSPLTITSDSLPPATLGQTYRSRLQASGGTPPYRWTISGGDLPDGVTLDSHTGDLSGVVSKKDKYYFTVTATDSSHPALTSSRDFVLQMVMPLLLEWSRLPQVQGHQIDGSVKVSNATADNLDLTVIIVAVSEIGKAFVLGYQRFDLKRDTINFEIPFGSLVPQGTYVVHADAIAEVAAKNSIYRQQLETRSTLPVTAEP